MLPFSGTVRLWRCGPSCGACACQLCQRQDNLYTTTRMTVSIKGTKPGGKWEKLVHDTSRNQLAERWKARPKAQRLGEI